MIQLEQQPEKPTVGEEMVQWAEKYWRLDKVCKGELPQGQAEDFNYEYFRNSFINAININIKNRLNL